LRSYGHLNGRVRLKSGESESMPLSRDRSDHKLLENRVLLDLNGIRKQIKEEAERKKNELRVKEEKLRRRIRG